MIEAARDVGIQDVLVFLLCGVKDRFDGIVASASRSKAVAVNLSGEVTPSARLQNRA